MSRGPFLLPDLLAGLSVDDISGPADVEVTTLVHDSRKAGAGSAFVAQRSPLRDGHNFCIDAYQRGCRVFIVEHVPHDLAGVADATIVKVADTRHALALMAARWFGYPAKKMTMIGLTGTKGKTTISFLLRPVLEAAGHTVGLIGSNGIYYRDQHVKLLNTTPESLELQGILADMADAGVDVVVLEATSQGFMMHRTDALWFDVAAFTNISVDHISATEHASFEEYFWWKKHIFNQTGLIVVNRDDPAFDEIVAPLGDAPAGTHVGVAPEPPTDPAVVRTIGLDPRAEYRAEDVELVLTEDRMSVDFTAVTPTWQCPIEVNVPGLFNANNALVAIAIADILGIEPGQIAEGLRVARVDGRMEYVSVQRPYTVLIDFAHNKLSMEALVETAKAYHPARILSVFGLEGDRAHVRRFDCGKIIGESFDYTILSDASPRTDDPDQILRDIATGIESGGGAGKYEIIRDRHGSIPRILDMARPGDLVLIIGKGNVPYEEVMGHEIPLDEHEIIRDYVASKGL